MALPEDVPPLPRGARRQHGDRAQRRVGRSTRPGRPHRHRRRRRGRRAGRLSVRADRRPTSRSSTSTPAPRGISAKRLGLVSQGPRTPKADCDLVVHASGSPAGLRTALELAGDEATVLEMSWYGDAPVTGRSAARSTAAGFGWSRARSERSRRRTGRAGRTAAGSRPRSRCSTTRGSTHCWRRRLRLAICRSGLPEILDRRKRHTLPTHHLLVKELPCSPSKFATTS